MSKIFLDCFLTALPPGEASNVKSEKNEPYFKLAGGVRTLSFKEVEISEKNWYKKIEIDTDVVDN